MVSRSAAPLPQPTATGIIAGSRLQPVVCDAVGITLLLLALLLPSSFWIDVLRTSPDHLREQLLRGGTLFSIGLGLLGLFVLVGGRQQWWWSRSSQENRRSRPAWGYEAIVLAGILAAATAARIHGLNEGLWLDEILTVVHYARAPFGEIITTYESQNQHFLFSLLAHTSFLLFGESPWALRF